MKQIALVIWGICLAAAPFAHADQWSKTYSIAGKPSLRIETTDANVHVDTWEQNTIEARVTTEHYKIDEHGIRIEEHQSGDTVEIEVHYPHDVHVLTFNTHSYRADIEIHMPREGQLNLHTGDGHIEVRRFKGDMKLQSGDGHQDLDAVDGTLQARAGDGHIHASGRFDLLDMHTGDGRIEAQAFPGSTVASAWELHTGDGSVTLKLPDKFAANLNLQSGDGHITVDMQWTVEGRVSEKNIHGKLNGGGNEITVHTGDGSIHLEKS